MKDKLEFKTNEERLLYLRNTLREINKKDGCTVYFGNDQKPLDKQSSGIKELDDWLGGGLPFGRVSVIWGGKGSAKSSLAFQLISEAQKNNKICYYVALEPFDIERAKLLGVDLDKLIVGKFEIAEDCLDSMVKLADNKLVDIIILDSIHSLAPDGVLHEKNGDNKSLKNDTMALLARKLSTFFPAIVPHLERNNILMLLIGQTRTDLGGFIALQKLTGGNALYHNAKIIIHARAGGKADSPVEKVKSIVLDENDEEKSKTETKIVGIDCVLKMDSTQITGTAPNYSEIHLPYYWDSGFKKKEIIKEEPKIEENKEITEETKKRGRPKKEDIKEENNNGK